MTNLKAPKTDIAKTIPYSYVMVCVAFLISVVTMGVYNAFGIFFKPVLTDFGWTRAMTSGAFSLSWIVQGLVSILAGSLSDRVGPRKILTLCGFILGAGYLLMATIGTEWQLYIYLGVLIGAGMGTSFVPVLSTLARWFVKRRNIMTGIVMAGGGMGSLIMSPIANQLITTYDWRRSYFILGSIVLVFVVLASQFLKRSPDEIGQKPNDGDGTEKVGRKKGSSPLSLSNAIRVKQVWVVFGMLFCCGFSVYIVIVHLVSHATDLGIMTANAANLLATLGGFSIVGRIVLGAVADKIGNRRVFIIGFIICIVSLIGLIQARDLWMLYLLAGIIGFASGLSVASSALIAELFGLSSHGLILGIVNFGYTIGCAIGPFVAGFIFDITGGYQLAFFVSAVIGVLGIILTILLTLTKTKVLVVAVE